MGIRLPLGKERFSNIRENGDYYIDKTDFINKLLDMSFGNHWPVVFLTLKNKEETHT